MTDEWNKAYAASLQLTTAGRESVRLTNLAVAAVLAHRRELLPPLWDPSAARDVLRESMAQVALSPLPDAYGGQGDWSALAVQAGRVADAIEEAGSFDGWVEATQSADPGRKTKGAYATPTALAVRLVTDAASDLLHRDSPPRVLDPSAGAGALLLSVLALAREADRTRVLDTVHNLHGVELDPDTRELCCLHLWLAAAPERPSLERIAQNVVVGNALTTDWWDVGSQPFDLVVMNPPWESLRHSVEDDDAQRAARAETLDRLSRSGPGADGLPPLYSAQGRGDRNLYKAFLELAPHLLMEGGRLGALIPSAFASDSGMAPLRRRYLDQLSLERWTSFENLRGHFPIDGRFKFGMLIGERSRSGTQSLDVRSFATEARHAASGHIEVTRDDLHRMGGPKMIIPELSSVWEKRTLARSLSCGSPLFEPGSFGRVKYRREVDLTLGRKAGAFHRLDSYADLRPMGDGTFVTSDGQQLVPLVEGRMVGQYDFFQKSWVQGHGRRAQWDSKRRSLSDCRPQFVALPAFARHARIAICDVTSATNTRTVHATWVPPTWPCGNTAPVLTFENDRFARAGLAVLNSLVFDWLARRIVAGLHLNKFYLETMVWPRLSSRSVDRLAAAATALCELDPKYKAIEGWTREGSLSLDEPLGYHEAHVLIEQTVAEGYGISASTLSKVLDPDLSDRRGFWRFFASEPKSRRVAKLLRTPLGQSQ